jgi:cathepsin L
MNNILSLPTKPLDVSALPSSVNWTAAGAVTSVKNQEQCGGCWAFAAAASLEGYNYLANGKLIDLSEQQLIDCVSNCEGCNGCSNLYNALEYTSEKGIESYQEYPFTGQTGSCQYSASEVIVKN